MGYSSLPFAHGGAGNAHGRRQLLLGDFSAQTQPSDVFADVDVHHFSFLF